MSDVTDDELASAYLDGEATDAERARVEHDPALLARVDRMRAARDALASAPLDEPDEAAKDAAIRTAVTASEATVIDLRRERVRRAVRIASIAAAVMVVVGAAGLLIRLAADSSSSTKSSTAAANSVPSGSEVPSAAGGAGDSAAESTAGLASLGAFADKTTLTTAVKDALGSVDRQQRATAPSTTSAGQFSAADDAAAPTAIAPACGTARPDALNDVLTTTAVLD